MAYTNNYTASDLANIVFENLGAIGAAIASFATLIGLVLIYKWFKSNAKF
jgi:hypothetical protein